MKLCEARLDVSATWPTLEVSSNTIVVERRILGVPTGQLEFLPAGKYVRGDGGFYYPAEKEFREDGSYRYVKGAREYQDRMSDFRARRMLSEVKA